MHAALTDHTLASHRLLIKAHVLAEAIVAEHYRRRPELETRYRASGRRHCVQDTLFHLQFLAASVGVGDSGHFARYVAWCNSILVPRGIPTSDLVDSLDVMRRVLASALPAEIAALACRHVSDALLALRQPAG
jgi:MerR family transcriptional regulator, light-induced transcriptional regulator